MPLRALLPDLGKIQMGMQVQQLSALLCAVLDHNGGQVTLTQVELERVHPDASLQFEHHPDGTMTLRLNDPALARNPSQPASRPDGQEQ